MWVTEYAQLRDPWWRFKKYVRVWLITMLTSTGFGWLVDGWNGVVFTCLWASLIQAVLFPVWEFGERRKDAQWRQQVLRETGHEPPQG